MLEILYKDDFLVAVNKPHGLLVHRSSIANDTSEFALQKLRDQIGMPVYPAHRLDRKTGGVLLFSLDKETDRLTQSLFAEKKIDKRYLAILRGFCPDSGVIDYPLLKENGSSQNAVTHFRRLVQAEIEVPHGKFSTSRYSLVEANPETGRMHQLRRHFAHILYPIIGDRPHGCNKQNKLWKDRFEMDTMLLHATSLSFQHPHSGQIIEIKADLQPEFLRVLDILNINL
ncbi:MULTISPECIES: pseudouridine synthase [Sphingobacterium]|uniref:pseudouridine synthase n=1 Tax=Sphingobacterium TaxID=28453 RepID=UPI0013D8FD4D|nr:MULTISPECIES: pseudouridine synthase [unclassified Sphingobacterium]